MNDSKFQGDDAPGPQSLQGEVIISPDTLRENRIPPRQARTRKWPVLDASGPPEIALDQWTFKIQGLVDTPVTWTWREFQGSATRQGIFGFPLRHSLVPTGKPMGRCAHL